nr:hypothetical protein [Serratia marcescens]
MNGKPAALATNSQVACSDDGPSMQMAQGSDKRQHQRPARLARGDKTNCDAQVMEGSPNVAIRRRHRHHLARSGLKCRIGCIRFLI